MYFLFCKSRNLGALLEEIMEEVHANPGNNLYIVTIFVKCHAYCFSKKEFITDP
jgi:hypothetical protein